MTSNMSNILVSIDYYMYCNLYECQKGFGLRSNTNKWCGVNTYIRLVDPKCDKWQGSIETRPFAV